MIRVQRLVTEVMHPFRLAYTIEVAGLWIGVTDLLLVAADVSFDLGSSFGTSLSSLPCKLLQPFFLVGQPLPLPAGFLGHVHQIL